MLHRGFAGRIRTMGVGRARDPVSETFDAAAAKLLARAHAAPGVWVQVWLPDPTIRQRTRWLTMGINVDQADNGGSATGRGSGGVDARTRWGRAFVRALYYRDAWYTPSGHRREVRQQSGPYGRGSGRGRGLRVEVGRHVAASPQFDPAHPEHGGLPPRRRVRVMLAAGGATKDRAVQRLSNTDRIWQKDGKPAGRFSTPALRDWA